MDLQRPEALAFADPRCQVTLVQTIARDTFYISVIRCRQCRDMRGRTVLHGEVTAQEPWLERFFAS